LNPDQARIRAPGEREQSEPGNYDGASSKSHALRFGIAEDRSAARETCEL